MVGADDVREVLLLARRLQVVHRRQVEQMVDLAGEPPQVRLGDAEIRLREVAGDRQRAAGPRAPEFAQRLELRHRRGSHQHEHAVPAREQALDEVAADEPGRAGDEVRHVLYCNPMTRETERMSAVDAAWLRMDRPTNLMLIVGVVVFESPVEFRRFRRTLEERFLAFPRFRCRARENALGADWEPDAAFDLDRHLVRARLPAPAGQAELEALVVANSPARTSTATGRCGSSISSRISRAAPR